MKEELQSKLVEILGSIQTAAGKAGDFAMTQLPDIAQQYVAYGRVASIFGFVLGLALLFICVRLARAIKAHVSQFDDALDATPVVVVFGSLGTIALGIAGTSVTYQGAMSVALVWIAPKVWLLKEIAGMLK